MIKTKSDYFAEASKLLPAVSILPYAPGKRLAAILFLSAELKAVKFMISPVRNILIMFFPGDR